MHPSTYYKVNLGLNLYSIMMPLKYHIFEIIMENGAFANAPFFIILSKVFKTLMIFFQCCLKIEMMS